MGRSGCSAGQTTVWANPRWGLGPRCPSESTQGGTKGQASTAMDGSHPEKGCDPWAKWLSSAEAAPRVGDDLKAVCWRTKPIIPERP